jgi:hypothetical protein
MTRTTASAQHAAGIVLIGLFVLIGVVGLIVQLGLIALIALIGLIELIEPIALIVFALIELIALIVLIVLVWINGVSRPPSAWWIRGLSALVGTTLLVLAITGPSVVADAADLLFTGDPGKPAAAQAETMVRLGLAALAVPFLIVPGTWMDVAAALLAALAVSAFGGDYKDTHAILGCADKPNPAASSSERDGTGREPANPARTCPTAAPKPNPPTGVEVPVRLSKSKVVAPVQKVDRGRAVVRTVVRERDADGRGTRTLTRRYEVDVASTVPKGKLNEDVIVNVSTRRPIEDLLADITAAKAIYILRR